MITVLFRDRILTITKNEKIRQNDSRTIVVKFLIENTDELDIFTPHARVNFLMPDNISGKVISLSLSESPDYQGYLTASILISKVLTQQIGELKMWVTFSKFNKEIRRQYYMTTNTISLDILPVAHIYDGIPDVCDRDLVAELQAAIAELQESKADDVELIDGEIWAMSNGEKIGDPVPAGSVCTDPVWEPIVGGSGGEDPDPEPDPEPDPGSELEERLKELEETIKMLQAEKADDVEMIDGEIWAMSDGKPIGDPIPTEDINSDIVWEPIN